MTSRTRIFVFLAALGILQSLIRLLGLRQLLASYPYVNYFSMVLGIAGLIALPALLLLSRWGYWGTLVVSAATIIFDLWAIFAIFWTALAGVFVPALLLLYLVPKQSQFVARR